MKQRPNFNLDGSCVAVVVPAYKKDFTADEETSFRHLEHFLSKYPKYFLVPKSLNLSRSTFDCVRFDDKYFKSALSYSALMLSRKFYQAFSQYKYILIYQLDALVFSDQLGEWCETDLDYIGAPWFECSMVPHVKVPTVGNGGFSLRKISSFLEVFNSTDYAIDPARYWQVISAGRSRRSRILNFPRKFLGRLKAFNGARWETSTYPHNEDVFWSLEATKYSPHFKVASVEEGLRFAFEMLPRRCFELNNYTLPFGCHAWAKYDRSFWEPYLLK